MTTKKTIYLIRHGQTDYNKLGIIQGSGINSSLNRTGHWQAQRFFEHHGHQPFNKIYTSKLRRTHESVQPFQQKGIPMEALEELNEINWGIFEGVKSTPEFHQEYLKIVNRWREGFLDEPIEGGESPNNMFNRQQKGWEKILSKQDEKLILICMHGRAMRSFLSLILETPLSEMDNYEHHNLGLYILENENDKTELKVKNDLAHLKLE